MDNFWLHCAKIVGTPTAKSGSWVHTFSPTDENKMTQRGHLLVAIGLNNFNGLGDLAAIGKEIVSRLQEEYYGDLADTAFNQLKKTITKVIAEAVEGSEFDLNIAAAVVIGNYLYGVMSHGGRLLLFRQQQIVPLLVNEENGSGFLQEGDIFLLGTEEFFRLVKEEILQAALKTGRPEEIMETLAPFIHGQPSGSSAAVIFRILRKETEIKNNQTIVSSPKESVISSEEAGWQPHFNFKGKWLGMIIWLDEFFKRKIIYLQSGKEKTSRSQKMMFLVALLLLVVLAVSVFFGMKQRRSSGENLEVTALIQQAQEKKEEGEALLTLNPVKAQQSLQEADRILQTIESLDNPPSEAIALKNEINNLLTGSIKEHQVQGEVFFDLELIKAGAAGNKLVLSNDQLFILDKNQKAVYGLGVNDKKSSILFGGEKIEGANFLAEANGTVYAFTNDGIIKGGKIPEVKIAKDNDWGEMADFKAFTGSLYLLDKKGEIWKYPAIEGGFGNKQSWLKTATDFGQAASLTIDGSLWVLSQDGKISKFLQGQKENISLSGLAKGLSSPTVIFTDFEAKNFYVLDKGNSRIVIFAKSGEYQSDYNWSEIGQANDMVVQEAGKKIFLLIGSKIYQLGINL